MLRLAHNAPAPVKPGPQPTIEQYAFDAKIYSVPPSKDSQSGQPTNSIKMPGLINHEGSDVGNVADRRPSNLNSEFLGSRSGGSLKTDQTADVIPFQ